MGDTPPIEQYPALSGLGILAHGFVCRASGVAISHDKTEVIRALENVHASARASIGVGDKRYVTAEQVHGCEVAVVGSHTASHVSGVDALVTADPAVCIGIHVADCAAVFFADPVRRVIGLAHSGRKGTELAITTRTIEVMQRHFGSQPEDVVVHIGPCIRPPHYEVDFAAEIHSQAVAAGVLRISDCGANTGADLARYYSYRVERGRTGRMVALLALSV